MILTAQDLRGIAAALDALIDIEDNTGVRFEGFGDNTLTTPSADTIKFSRKHDGLDDGRSWYVIEIEG